MLNEGVIFLLGFITLILTKIFEGRRKKKIVAIVIVTVFLTLVIFNLSKIIFEKLKLMKKKK